MAIGRGSMTKELVGNRQKKSKKMAMGGMVTPTDMMNQQGRNIAAAAQQGGMRSATTAPSRITPTNPASYSMGTPPMPAPQKMKKGGSVRGCGCAVRGKTKGAMY